MKYEIRTIPAEIFRKNSLRLHETPEQQSSREKAEIAFQIALDKEIAILEKAVLQLDLSKLSNKKREKIERILGKTLETVFATKDLK